MRELLFKSTLAGLTLAMLGAPALAGKANDTLVWSTSQSLASPDPYYNQLRERIIIHRNVCDGLIYNNPETREMEPLIATSWEQVDETSIDFVLRQDVTFHGGQKLTADDVVYTYNWLANPDSGIVNASAVAWIAGAEKIDDYTVRIKTRDTNPTALARIADDIPILPNDHYADAPAGEGDRRNYGAVPLNCTGPYKVTGYVPGESITMVANEDYFSEGSKFKPHIQNLEFRTIADQETQIAELLTGGVGIIWIESKDRADFLARMGRAEVKSISILRMDFLQFETLGRSGSNPFQDIRVRQAVAHAINREAIAKNLVGDSSEVIHSHCSPTQFGCTQDVRKYDYDPERAKELLAEAGFADGFDIDFYTYRSRETTEAMVGDLRAVGIQANLRSMQFQALLPMQRSGEAQFSHLSWASLGLNDAVANTSHYFRGRPDDQHQDAEVIAWLEVADTSLDPAVREEHYKKALQKIAEEAYTVPLWTAVRYFGLSPDLEFQPHFDDIARFWAAEWK
ncbi:MAG: ABC transporter substrate-binding protein [Salinarimonadaceae bacterium]|nr:MAG: ABC transporter substrate-binding protein [Salinarimonadaceae bacterium]